MIQKQSNLKYLIVLFVLLVPILMQAQESLEPLSFNQNLGSIKKSFKKSSIINSAQEIFFDDFSYAIDSGSFPLKSNWKDSSALANDKYGVDAVNYGVVTLDAYNYKKQQYDTIENKDVIGADTLTSVVIDLGKYTVQDSLYLSFFYQAQGIGDFLSETDSLKLEFYSQRLDKWFKVWSLPGMSANEKIKPFQLTMLRLNDTTWLKAQFRFRFVNLINIDRTKIPASLNTQGNVWNIDHVYLGANRNYVDTNFYFPNRTLPFFDDFSYASDSVKGMFPSQLDWADKNVFINNNYCINPASIGVATFDGLDKEGKIYLKAENNTSSGADTLTSRQIDLKKYSIADSLYFSFYYQAAGLGEIPDKSDSLKLEFYSGQKNSWFTVWSNPGMAMDDTIKSFRIAMVKLNNSLWFDSRFKFRFINYVSINIANNAPGMNTNGDIWNLDYVYLNSKRNLSDTTFNDIAITEPVRPFLKKFTSIPWRHYLNHFQETNNSKFYLKLFNHRDGDASVADSITIRDVYQKVNYEPINSAIEINSNSGTTFEEDCPRVESDGTDSALFQIKAQIIADDTRKSNNTIISYQKFANYYAYDDGSAEYGYGLRGDNTALARVAYKIDGYQPDTLVEIQIFFNRSNRNENVSTFNLMVWNEKSGLPGDSIGGISKCTPQFEEGFNTFHKYKLDTPIVVPAKYYIGWKQTDEKFLNVGYDRNNNATGYILYNTEGTQKGWIPSKLQKKGALMIRAIYGKNVIAPKKAKANLEAHIYPNPATNYISFNLSDEILLDTPIVSIIDLTGNLKIKQRIHSNNINIQSLIPGIYIISVQISTGVIYKSKLIKQ
jgi:hypothetical protein